MLKVRNFVILAFIYLIVLVSFKIDINLFYPYEWLKNFIWYPLIVSASNKELKNNDTYYEAYIQELKDDILKLQELNNIKTISSDYEKINTTVISRNREYWFNSITIDKGKKDGIENDMAVIDKSGLIGRVMRVYNNMSEVKLITTSDVNNKIGVLMEFDKKRIYGVIQSYNNGYLEVVLTSNNENIPKDTKVMTSGLGGIYPSGILIGKVEEIKDNKFNVGVKVLVEPSSDFNDMKYLAVLRRK